MELGEAGNIALGGIPVAVAVFIVIEALKWVGLLRGDNWVRIGVFVVSLLFVPAPVNLTRSLTANLPSPVSTVDVEDIDPLVDMLMSVPVMSATWFFCPDNVVLVCAIVVIY